MKYNGKEYYSQGDVYNAIEEENARLVQNLAEYKNEITDLKEENRKLKERVEELEKEIEELNKMMLFETELEK